ncbi:MAG TPA: gamma carbonic anhydrase family protein [Perlabentimonas sp.]|nr:gamma carbonic anhydrase family protein [Tenuifilaceae bacterium]HZJ73918.1 gamma carbonic anhydrase family protein [Perlabentimonas sp.]
MAIVKSLRGKTPVIGKNCFIAETAVIIGDVEIGDDCSVWYGAVLRGDVNPIRIGNRVSVQDNAVLHTTYQKSVVTLEDDVSIGHNATVHGATVRAGALVGIGATVLDFAEVGEGAIVAANALVLASTQIEPGSIYAGVPAKFVKKMDFEQSKQINQRIAKGYLMYKGWYEE